MYKFISTELASSRDVRFEVAGGSEPEARGKREGKGGTPQPGGNHPPG